MLGGNSKNVGGFSDKSTSPLIVAGLSNFITGSVNPYSMFGNKSPSVSPIKVDTNVWTSIACGGSHTIAVKSDGTLWGWGYNGSGQLGIGLDEFGFPAPNATTPVQIGTDTNWASVACGGSHTIAVKTTGTLWGWGNNGNGQVGDGTTTQRTAPVQIGSDTNWASVACGGYHTMAIKTTGTLWGWGSNDESGQVGDGTLITQLAPVQIGFNTNWASVSCGLYHTIAVKTTGTLWAWGNNQYGQLGDATTTQRDAPVQIGFDTNWASVACGDYHTIAIKTTGTLWGWGYNATGQLGDGTTTTRTAPVQIGSDTTWSKIAAGARHNMAIKTTGTLWAWGQNAGGQFGVETISGRGGRGEQFNKRNVLDPMEVGTLIDGRSVSIWAYAIPGKAASRDYNYYYYYYYDDDSSRVDPYRSNTLAAAVIYPNAKT